MKITKVLGDGAERVRSLFTRKPKANRQDEPPAGLPRRASANTSSANRRTAPVYVPGPVEVIRSRPAAPAPIPVAAPTKGTPGRSAAQGASLGPPKPRETIAPLVTPSQRLVDEVTSRLAELPAAESQWSEQHKAQAVGQLLPLLTARAGMLPQTRAKADALLQRHLTLLLRSVDEGTGTAPRNALIDVALQLLGDAAVPFSEKAGRIDALMRQREHFLDQIRTADDAGRAPAALRRHALPLLTAYRRELMRLQAADQQPSGADWDNLVLPLIIEAQNARTEGLNAKLFTMKQLARRMQEGQHQTVEHIGILDFGATSFLGSGHHAAVHASTAPDRPPRVTVLDSVSDPSPMTELERTLPPSSRIVPVHLQTQKAEECVIYATAAAKKVADHRDVVNDLHSKSEPRQYGEVFVHRCIPGPDELPMDFFKHSQSRKTLDRLAAVGQESGRHDAHADAVNKKGQTIYQRWDEHRVERPRVSGSPQMVTYSASIEPKRLAFIDQAIAHFSARQ